MPPNEKVDANEYANHSRVHQNLKNDQNLLVALAWVVPSEQRMFKLYLETLFVDSTESTNNEERPLLTMGGCDSSEKMFTFLRAFLPNQRTWSFRWIFYHVLPTMFSKNTISKIKVIISDGDAQEYDQIDHAINLLCPHVERIRCGWHVIDRGWDRHGPTSNHYYDKLSFQTITSNVRDWMFSWCSLSVETEEEFNISKQFFVQYVCSKDVIDKLDITYSKIVLNFFRLNVEPVLPNLVFYTRKKLDILIIPAMSNLRVLSVVLNTDVHQ